MIRCYHIVYSCHRPPRGVTRDAVEEHGGEPVLENEGDPLDQVVDHLPFALAWVASEY